MKILACLLSLCLVHVAFANEEPNELTNLRKAWEKSVAQEMEKKNKIYLKALEKLQKKFTGANNLAAAVAVNDEIKMVRLLKPEQQRKSPLDGVWVVSMGNDRSLFVFNGDRAMNHAFHKLKWEYVKDSIVIKWPGGGHHKIKPKQDDPSVMDGVRSHCGSKLLYERIDKGIKWDW